MAAPVVGIIGQAKPGAAANVDLVAAPGAGRRSVLSSIVITDTGNAATTFRIFARPGGAASAVGNAISYDTDIAAKGRYSFVEGVSLGPTDVLTVQSASGGLTFTAFGETSDIPPA